jgi:hypothetical protein
MTGIDIAWSIAMVALMMLLGLGAMMIAAAFVTPAVLPPPVGSLRHGMDAVIEPLIFLGGLVIGEFIALLLISSITRRFLDPGVHERWVLQFENGKANVSPLLRRVSYYMFQFIRAKDK